MLAVLTSDLPARPVSALNAAETVLAAADEPLHYGAITERA